MSVKLAFIDLLVCSLIAALHLIGVPLISENIGTIILGTFIIRFLLDMFLTKEKGFQKNSNSVQDVTIPEKTDHINNKSL